MIARLTVRLRAATYGQPTLLYPQRPSDAAVEQLEAIALPKGHHGRLLRRHGLARGRALRSVLWVVTRSDIAVNRICPLRRCLVW